MENKIILPFPGIVTIQTELSRLSSRLMVKNELESTWKEAARTQLEVISQNVTRFCRRISRIVGRANK
jgi:hypothetical protein